MSCSNAAMRTPFDELLAQVERTAELGGVVLHAPDMTPGGRVLRLNRHGQCFDGRQVHLRQLADMALFVVHAPEIDLVEAVRQEQRHEQRKRAVPPGVHARDDDRRHERSDEVVGRAPEILLIPHPQQRPPRGQRDNGGHEQRVAQKIRERRGGNGRDDETALAARATRPGEHATAQFHREDERRHAEERPVPRVAHPDVERALRPASCRRHPYRRARTQQEQRTEIHGEPRRQRGHRTSDRQLDLYGVGKGRQQQQRSEQERPFQRPAPGGRDEQRAAGRHDGRDEDARRGRLVPERVGPGHGTRGA